MLPHEKMNKTRKEDLLTSNVLGRIGWYLMLESKINKRIFDSLFQKLNFSQADIEYIQNEPRKCFLFWKKISLNDSEVEPDVIIRTFSKVAIIEIKLDSDIDPSQLKREYEAGKCYKKEIGCSDLKMFVITNHHKHPSILAPKNLGFNIEWISWQKIFDFFDDFKPINSIHPITKQTMEDIKLYMDPRWGKFGGFPDFHKVIDATTTFFSSTYKNIPPFIERINANLVKFSESIVEANKSTRDGRTNYPEVPNYYMHLWRDEKWNRQIDIESSVYLFIKFDFTNLKNALWVGVCLGNNFGLNLELMKKKAPSKLKKLCKTLTGRTFLKVRDKKLFLNLRNTKDFTYESSLNVDADFELLSSVQDANNYVVEFCYRFEAKELSNEGIEREVAEKLSRFGKNLVNTYNLWK